MANDTLYWIWLAEQLGAANRDFRTLIELYDQPFDIFSADVPELERVPNISQRNVTALSEKSLTRATEILDACQRLQIGILPYGDPSYPRSLRELDTPPVLLYYRGALPDFDRALMIGMVGTRRMSEYGLRSAYKIAYEISSVGALVVSGMAAGIDGVCAAAALAASAPTVAVLGCGIDVVYPKHHGVLKREIEQKGLLLSEYPPATRPNHYHFPTRNRLISGLTQGTVVVEAGVGSGSLITAKNAILQGRDVFALPANVGSRGSEGTNGLLRDGANLVLGAEDILTPYQYAYAASLNMHRLAEAKAHAQPDLAYLARLGVVTLTDERDKPAQKDADTTRTRSKQTEVRKPFGTSQKTAKRKAATEQPAPQPQNQLQKAAGTQPSSGRATANTPDAILSSLTDTQRAVLDAIPDDRAITVDAIGNTELPYGEIIAALTMLEILGLVQKLPGALYTKS